MCIRDRDYTAYFQQVPKQKLAQMMQLEADRMRHLNLDPKEFAQESKVVMEERRLRTDDQPQSLLFEQMNAVALQAHPYRVPVIGWMNDLENMTDVYKRQTARCSARCGRRAIYDPERSGQCCGEGKELRFCARRRGSAR